MPLISSDLSDTSAHKMLAFLKVRFTPATAARMLVILHDTFQAKSDLNAYYAKIFARKNALDLSAPRFIHAKANF